MSAADLTAVLVSICAIAAFVVLLVTLQALLRTLRELRSTLDRLHTETLHVVDEMRTTVSQAGAEVERVDQLLDAAESIQHTVDSASRLTYLAFSSPLIKIVALFKGIGRGIRRVFGRPSRKQRALSRRRAEREARKAA